MGQSLTTRGRDAVAADLAAPSTVMHELKNIDIPVSERLVGLGLNSKRTDSGSNTA